MKEKEKWPKDSTKYFHGYFLISKYYTSYIEHMPSANSQKSSNSLKAEPD